MTNHSSHSKRCVFKPIGGAFGLTLALLTLAIPVSSEAGRAGSRTLLAPSELQVLRRPRLAPPGVLRRQSRQSKQSRQFKQFKQSKQFRQSRQSGPSGQSRQSRQGDRSCTLTGKAELTLSFKLSHFGGPHSPLARWMVKSIEPNTCRALNDLLASDRRGAATFDADGTLWKDDVGEGFFSWMLRHRYYPEQRIPMLERAWRRYKAGTFSGEKMYELMVTGMAGMREQDVAGLARRYFDSQHKANIYQPMAALVSALSENGFSPWVVSGSPHWVLVAGARHFGIPASHVIGLRVRIDNEGRLTDEVLRPVPWKDGKAQRILQEIGEAPVIAAGNSQGDLQMLKIASALPLAINPAPDLMPYARGSRWYVNHFGNDQTLDRWLRGPSTRLNTARKK